MHGESKTIDLQKLYFSYFESTDGSPYNIQIDLEFTNTSNFNVIASVQENMLSSNNGNVQINYSRAPVVLDSAQSIDGVKTGKISFIISTKPNYVNSLVESYPSINSPISVGLSVDIDKTSYKNSDTKKDTEVAEIEVKQFSNEEVTDFRARTEALFGISIPYFSKSDKTYMERFAFYIEMGIDPVTNSVLRWLIVGIDNNGTLAELTESDKAAFAQGILLNKKYYLLSEKLLDVDINDTAYGISYQNNYIGNYNKYGIKPNDYATSNIRDYLKGKDNVKRSYKQTSNGYKPDENTSINKLDDVYKFSSSIVYSRIQGRSLSDLYIDLISESSTYTNLNKVTETPTSLTGDLDLSDDKFWILSETEFLTLFSKDKCEHPNDNHYLSAITTLQNEILNNGDQLHLWWLRSTGKQYIMNVRYVYYSCDLGIYGANTSMGVRPACVI